MVAGEVGLAGSSDFSPAFADEPDFSLAPVCEDGEESAFLLQALKDKAIRSKIIIIAAIFILNALSWSRQE